MVGRFESPELTREALAYEELCSRPGPAGCCLSLIAAGVVTTGLFAVLPSLGSSPGVLRTELAKPVMSAPVRALDFAAESAFRESFISTPSYETGFREFTPTFSAPSFGAAPTMGHPREEVRHLSLDFSLIALCIAVVVCCLFPLVFRSGSSPTPAPWGGSSYAGLGQVQGSLYPNAGSTNPFAPEMLGGGRGRIVDVKPGDLRGAGGYGLFGNAGCGPGWAPDPSSMDWAGPGPENAQWARGLQTGGGLLGGASASGGVAPVWQGTPSPGIMSSLSNSLGSTFSFAVNAAFGALGGSQQRQPPDILPPEVEASLPALQAFVDREIVEPLMRQLDESDQLWQQGLASRGIRFTTEAPRLQGYGLGPATQEISVFDRNLPRPLCDDPRAQEQWTFRQKLEGYLVHPTFEPAQRKYVLERLREWRQRGVASAMRFDMRPNDFMPTDAHILENLVVKLLNLNLDFINCFLASGNLPPPAKHLGQPPVAYLRQVTEQSTFPRPAPHYEVVTMQKTWQIRPGNNNILEALGLLLFALRRHSRSYQSFPQVLRTAFEGAMSGTLGSGQVRPFGGY